MTNKHIKRLSLTDNKEIEDSFLTALFSIKKNCYWPCCETWGILVPQPGIKPAPSAVEARSLNHQTIREVPFIIIF